MTQPRNHHGNRRFLKRFAFMLLLAGTATCVFGASPPQFPDLDFAAIVNRRGAIVHLTGNGEASIEQIDFLKDEPIALWDMASLDQVVIADQVQSGPKFDNSISIRYYKNKIYVRSFKITPVTFLKWMMIIPEKNCLLVGTIYEGQAQSSTSSYNGSHLIKIDLDSGKSSDVITDGINREAIFKADFSITCRPVWDYAKADLIIPYSSPPPQPAMLVDHDSLARLNIDDFKMTDAVALGDYGKILGLLNADGSGTHLTEYGLAGGGPLYSQGIPGIIDADIGTGKLKMICKDSTGGMYQYNGAGIAIIDDRYVLIPKGHGLGFGAIVGYCVDVKDSVWRALKIPPFVYPISHKGLKMAPSTKQAQPPANQ